MKPQDLPDNSLLEIVATIEPTLKLRRRRDRHAGDEDIVLCPHGALLGDVASLGRDLGDVVPGQPSAPTPAGNVRRADPSASSHLCAHAGSNAQSNSGPKSQPTRSRPRSCLPIKYDRDRSTIWPARSALHRPVGAPADAAASRRRTRASCGTKKPRAGSTGYRAFSPQTNERPCNQGLLLWAVLGSNQ